MILRNLAPLLLLLASLPLMADPNKVLTRIAFGSCAHQDKPQPIWNAINADKPELFIFLGDNIYGDTEDMDILSAKYQKLADIEGFQILREQSQVLATWDDHDYGENDAGADYPHKQASRRIMLDFWDEPQDSPRRSRDSGIYTSHTYGPPGRRVQVLLLDLRWNRTPLQSVSRDTYEQTRKPSNRGPYEPIEAEAAELLGADQWQWLSAQLQKPADLRLIASSIQLLPEFTGWETWANFPHDRQRLLDLIAKHDVEGIYIISGDTHWAEFSRVDSAVGYPLWETTASGLTEKWKAISPNRHRLGEPTHRNNYGLLEIRWDRPDPELTVSIKGELGQVYAQNTLRLSDLADSAP